MDLAVNAAETALESKEIASAEVLRNQQLALQEELRELMAEGDAAGVIRVRNLLDNLPDQIVAADVVEIKKGISRATTRLAEIKMEEAEVRNIRGELCKVLDERIDAMNEARSAVARTDFELFRLRNEEHITVVSRREYKLRLENLLENAGGNKNEN